MNMKEKKLNSRCVYDGKMLKIYKDEVMCPNGNKSTREYVKHPGAVCILAKLNDKFIIEKQYRYPVDSVLYELPAGKLNGSEEPNEASLRELEEETGYKALKLEYLGYIYSSCGFTDEILHLYYASDLIKTKTNMDDDEIIELDFKTLDELKEMIRSSIITDAKTIATIMKFDILNKNN